MIPIGTVVAGASAVSGMLSPLFKMVQKNEPVAAATEAPSAPNGASLDSSAGDATALREVLGRYDVTHISPRQFSQMLRELRETGALDAPDVDRLTQILVDLDAEGIDPEEELDLVEFYTHRLDELQDRLEDSGSDEEAFAGVAPALAAVEQRLDWLTKFALMHSVPETVGVDLFT